MTTTTLSRAVLEKYPNPVFVETGTLWGDAVQVALDCGFETIYTIELNPELAENARKRFHKEIAQGRVGVLEGDSFELFPKLVAELAAPTTFWLDAHWDGGPVGRYKCPLPMELEALLAHPIRNHTLLIDDRRIMGQANSNWGANVYEADVRATIMQINPEYVISYEPGWIPDDIIAAVVR
jgi:hypothetical protein